MRGISKCVAIVAVCAAAAGCKPSTFRGVPDPDSLEGAKLQYYWQYDLKGRSGEALKWIALIDENLYCMSTRNRLTAINAATGVRKWTYSDIDPNDIVFAPLAHVSGMRLTREVQGVSAIQGRDAPPRIDREKLKDLKLSEILDRDSGKSDIAIIPSKASQVDSFDAVIFNTNYYVTVLDRSTGAVRRHIPFVSPGSTPGATFTANTAGCSDGRYFFAGGTGGRYTGGRYHAIALEEALHAWSLSTDDIITAPLAYHNGRLFVASEDHHLYSAQIGTQGKRVWRQKLDGSVIGSIYADARGCFVPCQDNRLYAFDSMAGSTLWDPFVCVGPLSQGIQVGEDTIFQFADRDGLYAINVANGRKRWHTPSNVPCKVVSVIGGMVYLIHGQAAQIQVVDELLGKVKHAIDLPGNVMFAGNATMPAIYLATPDGRVFCVRLRSAGRLTEQMLRG